jgi:hypothetical protein
VIPTLTSTPRFLQTPAWRAWIVRGLGYALAVVALTWPLLAQITTHLGALHGPGDPYLNLWILGWDLHALSTDPWSLLSGRIFDANIFHPAAGTLAYSEHLILQAAALLPLYWASGDVVFCYNVLLLASLAANGLAMHAYARAVTGSEPGAWIAGLAWALWPYHVARLLHIQLQALYFLPLALLFLHKVVAGRRRRDVVGLGVFAGLQAISSLNYGIVTAVALGLVALALLVGVGRWRSPAMLARLAAGALIGALLLAPFAWPYWRAQQREGFTRNLYEASHHAARPSSYLQVSAENVLYGRTHLLTAHDEAGRLRPGRLGSVEHVLFPGFVLIILAVGGVWWGRRSASRPVVWAMLLLVAAGFVLSLGPGGVRWLYAAAYHHVFGFQAIRAPARFGVLVTCGAAILAALAVATAPLRRPSRVLAAVAAVALMMIEYVSVPLPYVVRPPRTTAVGQWLAGAQGPGAVLHLPLTLDARNTGPMVQSIEHWRPIVNGHSGQRPAFFTALVDVMSEFPSAEALWTLRDFNVRFIVSPGTVGMPAASEGAQPLAHSDVPLVERARFPGAVIYELVWTLEREARLPRPAPPPPPAPDAVPFSVGERATYDVRWLGGGFGMSAGRATITVRRGEEPGGYELVARAETADWVRQFFDAQNEYTTVASSDLLPLRHSRREVQGRRDLTRVFTFDHAERSVRIQSGVADGGASVTLSIPPGTRDALTALYYARSVRLAPGDLVKVPLNDGGRNLILELRAAAEERITIGGRDVAALRLEPRVIQRVARRRPLELTVWLSLDERRVPLRADVSAGFGRVRVELASYDRH